MPWHRGQLSIGIVAFIASVAASPWEFPRGSDGSAMLATAESLLRHGTLAIDARFTADDGYAPSARRGPTGNVYAKYGLGLPVAELPFLGLARAASLVPGLSQTRAKPIVLSLLNPLLTAIAVILIEATCVRLGASASAARFAALGYGLATPAWVYAVNDGAEALQACLVALSAWALTVFERDRRDWALWVCGAALGWGVLTKTTIAVVAPAVLVGAWCASRAHGTGQVAAIGKSATVAAPFGLGLTAIAWLNWTHFGSVMTSGYNTPVLTYPLAGGLYGLLLGPNKGLVFYAPLVLLAPVGILTLVRRSAALAVVVTLGTMTWTGVNAMFYEWGGGWVWGPRYLLPILPLVFVAVGVAVDRARIGGGARALCAAGFLVNLLGVVVDEDAYRRTTMRLWMADQTGYVTAGGATSGEIVRIPRKAEDVLPRFSSIAGHWWLARVALARCDCSAVSAKCGCRTGELTTSRIFLSPPWIATYPDAVPSPPYGASIIQPRLLRAAYRAVVFDPDEESGR